MADGEFRNNRLSRALTWNPDNVLAGARHITLAGDYAYIAADTGLVVVDLSTPLEPKVTARLPLTDARASAFPFRHLWVTAAEGVKLFAITHMDRPVPLPSGTARPADSRTLYVARHSTYVAATADGTVIVDVAGAGAPGPA